MASIFQRGDTWWIHYSAGGKSVSRSLKTKYERVALEEKRRIEALELTHQLPAPSVCPIKTVLEAFCQFLISNRTHKSAKNEFAYLRAFFGPCCPALEMGTHVPRKFRKSDRELPKIPDKNKDMHVPVSRLEQISSVMISTFIQRRIEKDHIAPKTANRQREVLHRLFSYAIEHHEYICPDRRYRNPVEGVRPLRASAPEITWLNHAQIAKQLDVLVGEPQLHALVAVYIYAGLRREEALWLTPADVDLERRLIRITAKTVGGESWQPKTKRNRVVPISAALLSILKAYKRKKNTLWFFATPQGRRWDPDNFADQLREVNRANGLDWSCLDFRHTFGSHLAQKGESLFKISALMGNSPEICRRHYAALVPEAMHDTVEFGPDQTSTDSAQQVKIKHKSTETTP